MDPTTNSVLSDVLYICLPIRYKELSFQISSSALDGAGKEFPVFSVYYV